MPQSELEKSICVVGTGVAGLITAHVLIRDGFRNVEVISRDATAGGVWHAGRAYPGLVTNNVYGEFEFSALTRTLPPVLSPSNNLDAEDMRTYLENYAERFLKGKIRYRTEVTNIWRREDKKWIVFVTDLETQSSSELQYDKVVVCSGGCNEPKFPPGLSPQDALDAGFSGPVFHTHTWGTHQHKLLNSVRPLTDPRPGRVVVIGGGGSAQDAAAFFANNGRQVTIVFETMEAFLASPIPPPNFIRRSRFITLLSPTMDLRSRLAQFLHTTWLGSLLVIGFWKLLTWSAFKYMKIPKNSPLRRIQPLYNTLRVGDIGNGGPHTFHALANAGKIDLAVPARASHYSPDGRSVVLQDGRVLEADAVILGTGYKCSWNKIMDNATREELGLNKQLIPPGDDNEWSRYLTLPDVPPQFKNPEKPLMHTSFYRGLVPTKNLLNHDFAVNGATYTANNGYCCEVFAHWIASYLRKDLFLHLPSSPEAAKVETDRVARWIDRRHPGEIRRTNESFSTDVLLWTWPAQLEAYLEDMKVPGYRSGGNWFTWPFKTIDIKELEHLTEERAAVREQYASRSS